MSEEMKEKRVCVLTHYYKSHNYGGLLQSYAMCVILERLGVNAKQASFLMKEYAGNVPSTRYKIIKRKIKNFILGFLPYYRGILSRYNILETFADSIPHTRKKYDLKNIKELNDMFDCFIVGSDQVWNLNWYNSPFFCEFAEPGKKCIAYAASMGVVIEEKENTAFFAEHLEKFDAISVREEEFQKYLKSFIKGKKIDYVLDPTLLLSRNDWDLFSSKRVINEKYMFCYFLDFSKRERDEAKKYAKKKGYKIVMLPHLNGRIEKNDLFFSDINLYKVTPNQFVSLIKYAECIFTDSFHAVVFSNIYKKRFYVFNGDDGLYKDDRILSVTRLFGTENRYIYDYENVEDCINYNDLIYDEDNVKWDELREKSIEFLKSELKV